VRLVAEGQPSDRGRAVPQHQDGPDRRAQHVPQASRDLASWTWPHRLPESGIGGLRSALYDLRRHLGDPAAGHQPGHLRPARGV